VSANKSWNGSLGDSGKSSELMSRVKVVVLSDEVAEMRPTRSYFAWSRPVTVKESSKSCESAIVKLL